MTLNNPDTRRALRAIVQAIVTLGILALVWRLAEGRDTRWLIAVLAIPMIGYQVENGVRSFKGGIGSGGVTVDVEGADQ